MAIATIQAQGQVYEVRRLDTATRLKRSGGGIRGVITGFSRASRRRLIDLAARLDTDNVRKTFLTLTFSGSPEPDKAKVALKRFTMRLRRAYPNFSAIWRLERQERGAIHFHLICFSLPYIPQRELQSVWEKCTDEDRSILHIKLLNSSRAVMNYVSKYIAKGEDGSVFPSLDKPTYQHATGRHWGYVNKESLPMAASWSFHVADGDAVRYAMWGCFALSNGRAGRSLQHIKLFCDDALDMLKFTLSICDHQGWKVLENLRLKSFRCIVSKMPYCRSYAFNWKAGFRPLPL